MGAKKKNKNDLLVIRMTEDQRLRLDEMAEHLGVSSSELVRKLIDRLYYFESIDSIRVFDRQMSDFQLNYEVL